jgi:hypothetical protein
MTCYVRCLPKHLILKLTEETVGKTAWDQYSVNFVPLLVSIFVLYGLKTHVIFPLWVLFEKGCMSLSFLHTEPFFHLRARPPIQPINLKEISKWTCTCIVEGKRPNAVLG